LELDDVFLNAPERHFGTLCRQLYIIVNIINVKSGFFVTIDGKVQLLSNVMNLNVPSWEKLLCFLISIANLTLSKRLILITPCNLNVHYLNIVTLPVDVVLHLETWEVVRANKSIFVTMVFVNMFETFEVFLRTSSRGYCLFWLFVFLTINKVWHPLDINIFTQLIKIYNNWR
jgi:hypothetical protein